MSGKFRVATMVAFCAVLVPGGSILAATLSGRVYEGSVGDESKPLAGVTVTLYGSNNSGQQGTYITSTTTNSDGWYGLEAEGAFDYFNIIQTNLSGYTSDGATSVGGSVQSSDWIQYDYRGLSGTTTGNKFWDKLPAPVNRPPVAVDDSYSVAAGGSLYVGAPGVLANDSDPDGDPLTAIQVSGPSNGTVTLNADGSFSYTPNPSFSGTDSFTYKANDGALNSNIATVTITVTDEDSCTINVYKWEDKNGDCVWDADEQGLANWKICLDNNQNCQCDPGEPFKMTDATGWCWFDVDCQETYYLAEEFQPGWERTCPAAPPCEVHIHTASPLAAYLVRFGNRQVAMGEEACCLPDGSCANLTPEQCRQQGGTPQGPGSACQGDNNGDGIDDICGGEPPEGEYDFGDAPDPYHTYHSSGGPYHDIGNVYLGSIVDSEGDGQPTNAADGDDTGTDDEDGVAPSFSWYSGGSGSVTIDLTGPAGQLATVAGWIDFNRNDQWDSSEQVGSAVYVCTGALQPLLFTFSIPSVGSGPVYARFRVYMGETVSVSPYGYGGVGEVEDYRFYVLSDAPGPDDAYDFGDAPDKYGTLHASGGPYHDVSPVFLGVTIDTELNGQPDPHALGDDNNGDDEDGLISISSLVPGQPATADIQVTNNGAVPLDIIVAGWLDFARDDKWDLIPDHIGTHSLIVPAFSTTPVQFAFTVPLSASPGPTFARFRLFRVDPQQGVHFLLLPTGYGNEGEVEDYEVTIEGEGPPGDCTINVYKWNDKNGDCVWDTDEQGLANWKICLDENQNCQCDPNETYKMTDATGWCWFDVACHSTYYLAEELKPGWQRTCPTSPPCQVDIHTASPVAAYLVWFGNQQSGGPTGDGRICGSKWNDLNGDGMVDAGESGLANWKIYLDMNQNGSLDPGEPFQLTDGSGNFEFKGLAAGNYTVAEEMQPGWTQTWPGGAGTHGIQIQQPGVMPACVLFGNQQGSGPGQELDWGDAPDPTYPTLRVSNGAYHSIVAGVFLGGGVDGETDGQPTPDALGDDISVSDDEDGVFFLTPILPGQMAGLEIAASAAGYVDAWIDLDVDGTWNPGTDQILKAEPVTAGFNVMSVAIPGTAAINVTTYARFRFSSIGNLPFDGPASDGEVEDYHLLLGEDGPYVPGEGEEQPHLKWSQPPLEIDPKVDAAPFFCGWDEAARSTQRSGQSRQWRMDADDFHCLGPIPITRIRWWGGYKAWAQPEPPESQPITWHIGIWANQVEGLGPEQLYPERLVWSIEVPNERVGRGPAGLSEFPQQQSPEMCFVYDVHLEPEEWFHQAEIPTNEGIFWLSVTAVYPPDAGQVNMWGWTTRSHVWRDGAVMPAIMGEWPTSEERLFPGRITPIESSALCGQKRAYDLCFELLTEHPWIKWDLPFTGIREWPHYEDVESQGVSIRQEENIERLVADDWLCEQGLPVVALAWWGSYIGYGHEACGCDGQDEPPRPDYFLLRIWRNAPAGDAGSPDDVIWEYRAFDYDEVLVGYDKHPEGEPNEPVFRYTVRLPEDNWFRPENPGDIHWLSITAIYTDPLPTIVHPWGWTNHRGGMVGAAVVGRVNPPGGWRWEELFDQTQRPQDMSFTLFTVPEVPPPPGPLSGP